MLAVALLIQIAASPPPRPPLPSISETTAYWRSLQPIFFAKRDRVVCRAIGAVSAEFEYRDGAVMVVDVSGISHHLSVGERSVINKSLVGLGLLDSVSITCNVDQVAITVAGRPYVERGRSIVRTLDLEWGREKMKGVGGKPHPEQEVGPATVLATTPKCALPFQVAGNEAAATAIAQIVINSAPPPEPDKNISGYDLHIEYLHDRNSWLAYQSAISVDKNIRILGGDGLGMEIAACDGAVSDIRRER